MSGLDRDRHLHAKIYKISGFRISAKIYLQMLPEAVRCRGPVERVLFGNLFSRAVIRGCRRPLFLFGNRIKKLDLHRLSGHGVQELLRFVVFGLLLFIAWLPDVERYFFFRRFSTQFTNHAFSILISGWARRRFLPCQILLHGLHHLQSNQILWLENTQIVMKKAKIQHLFG